jgi:O-antigen ligase
MTAAPANSFPPGNLSTGYIAMGGIPGSGSGFQRLGYGVLVVYLFLIYSRIFDVKFASLHVPGISFRIILVMMLASQSFLVAVKTDIGRAMTFMFVWFVCSIPTSVWRRGSYEYLTSEEFPSFVVFLATVGLIVNFRQFRRAMSTLALAFLVLTLIAVVWGKMESGRLFLPQGKFSNPNEMAQALLLGMPLWWLVLRSAKSFPKRIIALGVLALMLLMMSRTGSRGAMIAVAVVLLCAFLRASAMGKLRLVVGIGTLLVFLLVAMPGKLLHRYATVGENQEDLEFTGDEDYDASMASAVSSSQMRQYLLKESLKLTLTHPLFGVGPSMFPVAEDTDAKTRGLRHGVWQGTHNSYTEVSSEIGIPGAIAYILAIALSLRNSWRLHKQTSGDLRLKDISDCAACLNYCLIVYAVTVLFDYIAFTSMLSVFGGITAALCRAAPAEIERRLALPAETAPIPFMQFRPNWRTTAGATTAGAV